MIKVSFILSLLIIELYSVELVVIGDKNFPETNLTRLEIKAIFLAKKRFIKEQKLLVMNHKANHPMRQCFEKKYFEKTGKKFGALLAKSLLSRETTS